MDKSSLPMISHSSRRTLPFSRLLLVVLGLLFLVDATLPSTALGCPTCKDTLGLHALKVQLGYALSIGFMMLVPFGILGGWSIAIYRMSREAKGPGSLNSETPDQDSDGRDDSLGSSGHQTDRAHEKSGPDTNV